MWQGTGWEGVNGINWKYTTAGKLRQSPDYYNPAIYISWNDATAYCKWLSQKTGLSYRLPTEAEWEYAAGYDKKQKYIYAGGDIIEEVAWSNTNSESREHPVGQKKINELGLYDMSGNVWEWCQDWYADDYYLESSSRNPQGPISGSYRVIRGGAWFEDSTELRVTNRSQLKPNSNDNIIGFRIARQQ